MLIKELEESNGHEKQLLTHSSAATFRSCPKKYYYKNELMLRPEKTSLAMRAGTAYHKTLDWFLTGVDPWFPLSEILDDEYEYHLVRAMVNAYINRYGDETLEVVASELPFQIPLRNPTTGARTPLWDLAGVIDRIVKLPDGRLALKEYKTTTMDTTPGSAYWTKLRLDPQLSIYNIAALELGYDIATIIYDVTKRPLLKPLMATPEDKRKYTKSGDLYAKQREEDETPLAYGDRVYAAMEADPEHYFIRTEIARLDQDLDECRAELWQQQLAIRNAQRNGFFYRNPNECFGHYGSACPFLPVCQNTDLDTVTPVGFVRGTQVHPELPTATPAG